MKLSIFGATGRTGQILLKQAIDAGHEVTVLVRNPARLALQHPRLKVIQGDLRDPGRVAQAVAGAEAVVSVLGPTANKPIYEVSQGMLSIVAAMREQGVRRLVVSVGAGVADPHDAPGAFNRIMDFLVKRMAGHVYEDMRRTVEVVRASGLDWTIVRVPMLTDQSPSGDVKVGYVGKGTGVRIARADMAGFMLKQAEDRTYISDAPAISN
jgi:putative NADH-flavin reductase